MEAERERKRVGRPRLPLELKKKYIGTIVIRIEDPRHLELWKEKVKNYRNGEDCLADLMRIDGIYNKTKDL